MPTRKEADASKKKDPKHGDSKNRDVERTVLANGVRVITEKMPHMRSASVGIWIGTGAREESEELTGISHFIEHMLFKGTKNRTAEQIARSADSVGQNYWVVANGIRLTGMPGYKGALSEEQMWQVSQFLSNRGKLPEAVEKLVAEPN